MMERMMDGGMMERMMHGEMTNGGMMDGAAGGGSPMLFALVLLALIAVVVVATLVALLAGVRYRRSAPLPDETAREVLDRRYANDELSRDEYLRRRQDLREAGRRSGLPR